MTICKGGTTPLQLQNHNVSSEISGIDWFFEMKMVIRTKKWISVLAKLENQKQASLNLFEKADTCITDFNSSQQTGKVVHILILQQLGSFGPQTQTTVV